MKKYLLGLAVLLMGTAVMTSCSDDNDGPETYLQVYSTGAYVVNSGNMYSKIESSLTAIDYASSTATQNVFKTANGRSLGNTANDGIVYGNKIYLAVDQSNTIEVIDKKTKQEIQVPLLLENKVLMTGDMVKDAQVRIGGSRTGRNNQLSCNSSRYLSNTQLFNSTNTNTNFVSCTKQTTCGLSCKRDIRSCCGSGRNI